MVCSTSQAKERGSHGIIIQIGRSVQVILNLCKQVGFRPAATALAIVFDWLGIDAKVPSWDSMRCWSCRVGIANLQEPLEEADDWIWMADHSNQIGYGKLAKQMGSPRYLVTDGAVEYLS